MNEQSEERLPDGSKRVTWKMNAGLAGSPAYQIEICVSPDGRVTVNGDVVKPGNGSPGDKREPDAGGTMA